MSRRLLVAAACILATSGVLRLAAATEIAPAPARLLDLPAQIGAWRAIGDTRLDPETESILHADGYLLRTYARGAVPVSLFVAYYGTQRSGRTIHSPLNCLPGTGWTWTDRGRQSLRADNGASIAVNRNVARKDGQHLLVYYWYQSRGRVVASDYANKLLLVRDSIALHRSDGALVRVTAGVQPGRAAAAAAEAAEAAAFVGTIYPALTAHLPE